MQPCWLVTAATTLLSMLPPLHRSCLLPPSNLVHLLYIRIKLRDCGGWVRTMKQVVGMVVSNKMQKSVVVAMDILFHHKVLAPPVYGGGGDCHHWKNFFAVNSQIHQQGAKSGAPGSNPRMLNGSKT
ncbi:hypothetical protein Ahy_B09g098950 [Arachis hypogaea]|uniref:Secreted protein n=1 Tax=Arachis hypogaea TaxID=3818 RepID=A0A444XTE2_ARAHY|nr:hypothetical protein Ahy_B09g098950 [Arachis hypogaea]